MAQDPGTVPEYIHVNANVDRGSMRVLADFDLDDQNKTEELPGRYRTGSRLLGPSSMNADRSFSFPLPF